MTEVLPFDEAPAAYERMMSGQARFRVVLDMQTSSQMGTERAGGR
jgi:propanol-preferring alcohol dehydrogenase